MPRTNRPHTTGYERLAQADQYSDDSDDDPLAYSTASLQPASAPRYAPITQPRPHSGMNSPKHVRAYSNISTTRPQYKSSRGGRGGRARSNSGVDLKAINARLERWADEIASKFKRKGKKMGDEDERLEIHHSVFQPPEGVRPVTGEQLSVPEPGYMTQAEFEVIIESVRIAIEQGVHPRMISQGSSGSYFARNTEGKVVGVFKPKDEEPYAAGNPKWNKWIHRNLFPCCFGRACLIPNLSYVSEAAAYVLDAQLRTHMVPYTDVVNLSSKSFHYPFWDRYNYSRNKKPLPAKPGSFQVFLKGFKDANLFLREHPWPDQYLSGFRTNDPHRKKKRRRWADNCRPTRRGEDDESDDGQDSPASTPGPGNFVWTETLKQAFREELEKLVILDYIMRNTDRGLDNWMIKVDWQTEEVSIVSEPIQLNTEEQNGELGPRPVDLSSHPQSSAPRASYPYKPQQPMAAAAPGSNGARDPKISIGAIDNSLSWPWKHPDAWRSFPFGWLFLPVDLIGRPFSQKTRDHFLPLLTSTAWWSQTQLALRRVFQIDPDFQERMFARQIAVMKGQAWNVVETLKTADHGPLELTRRAKVCVWDDLVDVPVAIPMRVTSAEMRRSSHAHAAQQAASDVVDYFGGGGRDTIEEEMDIGVGTASSSAPVGGGAAQVDLLGLGSPSMGPAELPHQGRFELTPTPSPGPRADEEPAAAAPTQNGGVADRPNPPRHSLSQPALPHQGRSLNMYSPERERAGHHHRQQSAASVAAAARREHQRRFSFVATGAGRRNSNTIAQQLYSSGDQGEGYDDDGLEGDLGYAAAEGMEGSQRKVIVERLEPVKTRNPVFTWC
ncbi:phosphatidylinositol 3 and 4-kinase-domain-containing protein [Coniochaeta sp. 2T2.1]|nr:phosphatidylinositol 3 and 4-kinase-domain-containing protein [Coniochaeta sp. 2T2.1]